MSIAEFPVLDSFGLLAVNNNRSKAYLQVLLKSGFRPSRAIVLESQTGHLPEQTTTDTGLHKGSGQRLIKECAEAGVSFDEKEHLCESLANADIPFACIPTVDINSREVIGEVSRLESAYVLYSGPGGAILRNEILSLGKIFVHAHPGWLPDFRGSTVFYYAILAGADVGCSVIFMAEEIDQGPILHRRRFPHPRRSTDIDRVYDPAIRTATLREFFCNNMGKVPVAVEPEADKHGHESDFYIIHPVLKHLAILSLGE